MARRSLVVLALACACQPQPVPGDSEGASTATTSDGTTSAGGTMEAPTTGEQEPETATVVHSFGNYLMTPYLEIEPCVQWTLHNDEAIYVNAVTLVNDGGFHHSNWFAVPEQVFAGEDGFWDCGSREYNEITAAVEGTVLFAQSTQSRQEVMQLPAGAVIKIPPRHKIVAGVHLLNLGSTDLDSELRMALDIIHPRDVDVVLAAMHLDYRDLAIPANKRSRFTGACSFKSTFEKATGKPFEMKLYHVLPHYHYLGEYFGLQVLGGARDGEFLFQLDGFNGDANGRTFDPPVDLADADGLRFACGFNNWLSKDIGYGIGDQEMCMMLGLVDARVMIESRVTEGTQLVGVDGEVLLNEAECANYAVFKNPAQAPPTAKELGAPLYVPPTDPGDVDLEPTKDCADSVTTVAPDVPATLTSVRDSIFAPSCIFSSCHDASAPAAGLDLQTAAGLADRLVGVPALADTPHDLVTPGDPAASWLYRLVSECEPQNGAGAAVRHMPFNAPTLLPDPLVAKLRAWIEAGALDD
ncbi:hypothetical protein [Nannocystis radixulma]|uniref:Cytochrome c domain-containing protein n=1 Tax=Nannocystis radixulma TaxID=2995305 RepID=A0ABT5B9I9_9BACT|nr:hypothetical protein [Nannocystis radixulma]MDC0670285.1 hypothetical protein [Nannocystis radixulma]